MNSRRVALEGPLNFRDLGGYVGLDGKTICWQQIYRSDSLHRLTSADASQLAQMGVKTAIDFRADDELDRIGIGPLGELEIDHVHLPTVDRAMDTVRPEGYEPPSTAAEVYRGMLQHGARAYAAALRTLIAPDTSPAVYFCMAGKDRTGIFSAVVLGLLGVSDSDIVADYALTQEVVEAIHDRRRTESPSVEDLWGKLPEDLLGAHASAMVTTLENLYLDYGSWVSYATNIGIEESEITALRAKFLELS
ncbi:MAG: tyrosine-protein phosphatase [Acidimicrobiia bacterium]|nr:tyrosine-protein phosphatase [Acidimicrobiia bacterium]